ncbi:MAG: endonuclease/exonuclease/phosphatase family protein [Bacteroidota bacterium]
MSRQIFILLLLLWAFGSMDAQSNRILIDDDLSDWANQPLLHSDPTGDGGPTAIDFRLLWASHDEEFFFLRFEVGAEVLLQQDNKIAIYIDTDNDPNTGFAINGIGANIRYFPGERTGFVHLNNGTTFSINHFDIGLVSSPTVSSDEFEIAIRRDLVFQGIPLFQGSSVQLFFRDNNFLGDQMPNDELGGISYTFGDNPTAALPPYSISRPAADQLRIWSQNVQNDRLFEPFLQSNFERIAQSIAPDIIAFQEIYDHTAAETADLLSTFLPPGPGEQWYFGKEDPDIILLSRYPILAQSKVSGFIAEQGNGAFLLDLSADHGTQLLVIVAHFPCCNNNEERQLEIDRLLQFLREAKAGNGPIPLLPNTPIVVTGDMNLVGDRSQQFSLINGNIQNESLFGPDFSPDWDGNPFIDAKLYATHQPLAITWINPSGSFSPGRLDYLLYTASQMELHNGFSLYTPSLPTDSLNTYNLQANDIFNSADHLPMVADFSFQLTTSTSTPSRQGTLQLWPNSPNPFAATTLIPYQLAQAADVSIHVHNLLGEELAVWKQGRQAAGYHQFELNNRNWGAGIYYYTLRAGQQQISRKMIIH